MATATDELAFELQLHPNWDCVATSESYETLLVEVENLLHDAPNVDDFYTITDPHRENTLGFAVILTSGERAVYIATLEDTIHFDGAGNLRLIPAA